MNIFQKVIKFATSRDSAQKHLLIPGVPKLRPSNQALRLLVELAYIPRDGTFYCKFNNSIRLKPQKQVFRRDRADIQA